MFTNIKLDFASFTTPFMVLTCVITSSFSSLFVLSGLRTSIAIVFVETVFTTCVFLCPAKNSATSSGFPTVADRHILWKLPESSAIRSNAIASCAPRLEFANSCTSSIITYLTDFKLSLSLLPGIIACIVSGVVMSISGGSRACFLLA